MLSVGKTAFWVLTLVTHTEQALCLVKKKKKRDRELNASCSLDKNLSDIESTEETIKRVLGERGFIIHTIRPGNKNPCCGPGAHLTAPTLLGQVQLEAQKRVTGLAETTHLPAAGKDCEATKSCPKPFSGYYIASPGSPGSQCPSVSPVCCSLGGKCQEPGPSPPRRPKAHSESL